MSRQASRSVWNISRNNLRVVCATTLLLAGCATPAPQVITVSEPVRVEVAVPVPCVNELPARPQVYEDAELAGMGDYALVLAIRRNGLALAGYAAELEAVLTACQGIRSPSP